MALISNRQEFVDYCLRQLGAPVLEINVDDDQIQDALDDARQLYNERHYNGVEKVYLKHELTQDDIDRGKASGTTGVGIVTTTGGSTDISGFGNIQSNWVETSNFIQVPEPVLGIERVFKFDSSTISDFLDFFVKKM